MKTINPGYNYRQNENDKYILCCNILSELYLKSKNGKINIASVLNQMDKTKNKAVILKRILETINKKIYFGRVTLSYSDYLTLQNIRTELNNQSEQSIATVLSMGALIFSCITACITCISLLDFEHTFINICIIILEFIILIFFLCIIKILNQFIGK